MLGLIKPSSKVQILGTTFSGVVKAVGSEVTQFQAGDAVIGMKQPPHLGTYAEYLVVDETAALAHKPKNVTHQEAAGVLFGGTTALYFLRDIGKLQAKERILIIGASGAVGTNAVQLAKYYGAHVTAVCSGKNAALVKSLGADAVIDYTKDDVSQAGLFDIVFTAAPGLTLDELAGLVKPGGRVLLVLTDFWGLLQAKMPFLRKKQLRKTTLLDGIAPERKEDVEFLTHLVAKKKLKVVIEKEYPLEKIVDAHQHADTGHKVGNIVINVV
jgi:NADPH:quinone reductase-like Zn-dependent oxidoreductase